MNLSKLTKYREEGWVVSHSHKTLPLIIWNYTQATQYEGKWDEITLACRGLVTDLQGNIVAKGFSKFFNYEEKRTNIPNNIEWTRMYDKLDGSYIQLFNYEGDWLVNSKGSFYSEQAEWAKDILKDKSLEDLNKTWTYCFELIHPNNRIVVDYKDKEDLIFLGAFCQGVEVDILSLNVQNKEGFIVKFNNGARCKIKFEDYIRLHRIMTEVSSYRVYEALKNRVDLNTWLEGVPDEFFNWIKEVEAEILDNYRSLELTILYKYIKVVSETPNFNDKEFALHIEFNKFKSYFFKLRKDRDISDSIWKEVKPKLKYPFKDEE